MDRDRYRNSQNKPAPKRSINSEEKPTLIAATPPRVYSPEPVEHIQEPETPAALAYKAPKPTIQLSQPKVLPQEKQLKSPEKPLLFDDEDEDIFGVWKTQKELKKAQKAEEIAAKLAKKASKKAAKERNAALKKAGVPREIAISVKVPRASKVKASIKKSYKPEYKKLYIAGASLVLLPIFAISAGFIIQATKKTDGKTDVLGQKTVAAKPDFSTLKPTTTENQATALKYDTERKLASYNDVLNNIPITVSQQPLPAGFKASPTTSVENLAKQMNANDKISASDTTAFAGVSIKGPQTVVFTKNDLLIFIIADKKIDVLTWSKYIESMR